MPVPIQQDTYPRLTPVDLSHFWDSREDRYLAWSALDPWFKTHGYTLYPQTSPAALRPEPSAVYDLSNDAVEYPYAFAHEKTPFGRAFYPAVRNHGYCVHCLKVNVQEPACSFSSC